MSKNSLTLPRYLSLFLLVSHAAFAQLDFLDAQYSVAGPDENAKHLDIQYGTGSVNDGEELPLHLDLYRPKGPDLPDQMPGIILIHGGSFRFGSKTTDRMPDLADYFASRGYIAVSINYRLRGDNPDGNNAALWAANDANQAFQWMVENSIEGGAYRRAYGR